MAKAVAKPKKISAKSKPSVAKPAPVSPPRKALKKGPAKPVAKTPSPAPAAEAPKAGKWVYTFGDGKAEGRASMRNLLGGKGANLAEMANLGLPVPPGFTITTEVCTYFYAHDKTYPAALKAQALVGVHANASGYVPPRSARASNAAVIRSAVEQGVLHGTRVALMFAFVVVGIGSLLSLLIPSHAPVGADGRVRADGFEPFEPIDPDPALLH